VLRLAFMVVVFGKRNPARRRLRGQATAVLQSERVLWPALQPLLARLPLRTDVGALAGSVVGNRLSSRFFAPLGP
jgi:hypothetical protein